MLKVEGSNPSASVGKFHLWALLVVVIGQGHATVFKQQTLKAFSTSSDVNADSMPLSSVFTT